MKYKRGEGAMSSSSEMTRMTFQEVKNRLDRGEKVYFLDVRGVPDDYQIKGSVCYQPAAILDADRVDLGIPKEGLIVPY
jgi:hypothetical protein